MKGFAQRREPAGQGPPGGSRPMRIAFVTAHYWPSLGGVERVAMNLADVYRSEGHEVSVVAQRIDETLRGATSYILREAPRFDPFSVRGVEVRQLRLPGPRRALLAPLGIELLPLLGRMFARFPWLRRHSAGLYAAGVRPALAPLLAGADIVHVLGGDLLALAGVETAHRLGRPAVVTPFAHPGPRGFDARAVRAWRGADAVLATVEADAAAYRDSGVAPERLHVCGVPVPALDSRAGAVRPPVPEQVPVVLFLGARRPAKGWQLLLESARLVWARCPQTRFAFVGPGEDLPPGDERLLNVGRVPEAQRSAWLRRATILALPSEWESFGLVLAEAWSQGVPAVVSETPVLRELVESSGGGVVAAREPGAIANAVCGLLERPELAREMGRAGRRYWQHECNPATVAGRHLAVYELLLRRGAPVGQVGRKVRRTGTGR